jgi:hypothetical protein
LAPDAELAQALDKELVALGGDIETDSNGKMLYAFPRVKEELAAMDKARVQASAKERDPGAIVFSSKD